MKEYKVMEGYRVPAMTKDGNLATYYKRLTEYVHVPVVLATVPATIQVVSDGLRVLGTFRGPDNLYHVMAFWDNNPDFGYEGFVSRFLKFDEASNYGFIDRELPMCEPSVAAEKFGEQMAGCKDAMKFKD